MFYSLRFDQRININSSFINRLLILIFCIGLIVQCSGCSGKGKGPATESEFLEANLIARNGREDLAIKSLTEILARAEDDLAYRCQLALGNLLIKNQRPDIAIPMLKTAADTKSELAPYALLLLMRAYELAGTETKTLISLAEQLSSQNLTSGLLEEIKFLEVKSYSAIDLDENCAMSDRTYLRSFPSGKNLAEIRWILAQCYDQTGTKKQSFDLCETIWIDNPKSPFALDALNLKEDLQKMHGFEDRRFSKDDHFNFFRRLQRAGRHAHAIKEIKKFIRISGSYRKYEAKRYLTESYYNMRKNEEAASTANEIRRSKPGGALASAAAIFAIKSMRRIDNTKEVRNWCNWTYNKWGYSLH